MSNRGEALLLDARPPHIVSRKLTLEAAALDALDKAQVLRTIEHESEAATSE